MQQQGDVFDRDTLKNAGYLYTTNASLSSRLANQRLTEIALMMADWHGKRVLDFGCGDGTYTLDLFDLGRPTAIHGFDPAQEAIKVAQHKRTDRRITFAIHGAYALPYAANSFDIAHVRGVLHHLDRPVDALHEALRVASTVLVIEPNGYNLGLKLLERYSRYHIQHGEKSYAPASLNKWVTDLGAMVMERKWVGLVPFFCPDWLARILKTVEPLVERLAFINVVGCAVYVFIAQRSGARGWPG